MTTKITETNEFIVLDKYTKIPQPSSYQSETDLENELIHDLINQGYEYLPNVTNPKTLLSNLKKEIERLNNINFSETEWKRFLETYLNRTNDSILDRSKKIHEDYLEQFKFDNGTEKNIRIIDKKNIFNNKLQVINQFCQKDKRKNRYDVVILVNGLPLVLIELKRRGIAIREAFNQIHRYQNESLQGELSLFKYIQIFIISNGTDTRYFANTTQRDKNSFDFTINWASSDNRPIKDLKDFTATFLEKRTLLEILTKYIVLQRYKKDNKKDDSEIQNIIIMRPYQIAATERIIQHITISYNMKKWSKKEGWGYIWHTTGSGKTLTSFKTAQLATQLDFIKKVFFVVDRKDLDNQTLAEYRRFDPESVDGSINTKALKRNLENGNNKIIVTTIQKLNRLIKQEDKLDIYNQQVVFIFDEAHRSQFGEAQRNIRKKFKKFYQFGFTGTPIFEENSINGQTTSSIFGRLLHSYIITDALRDEKVLGFKVDYLNLYPKLENQQEEIPKQLFLHPNRIEKIAKYILNNFHHKTNRIYKGYKGFNALFAVESIEMAKLYYTTFKKLQKDREEKLKIFTIFSSSQNGEESFTPEELDNSSKLFLEEVIREYNQTFQESANIDNFDDFYQNVSNKLKNREIDILIVVGMFLTGFDAPTLNTLFVDKNLKYHGLIQAFSRTNRIYDRTKPFGNIVTFRNLEPDIIEAFTLFGSRDKKDTTLILFQKQYREHLATYIEIVDKLKQEFPSPDAILSDRDKREFVQLFGKYLQIENILNYYDEFIQLKEFKEIDSSNPDEVDRFLQKYNISKQDIEEFQNIELLPPRQVQDYKSIYNDIRQWLQFHREEKSQEIGEEWNSVIFEIELLKSQDIDLDYILNLIYHKYSKGESKSEIIDEVKSIVRSSFSHRAKEHLIIDFIQNTDFEELDRYSLFEKFYNFAREKQRDEVEQLISKYSLDIEIAKMYIREFLYRQFVTDNGDWLRNLLPKISPLKPKYRKMKKELFRNVAKLVEKFKGIGGEI